MPAKHKALAGINLALLVFVCLRMTCHATVIRADLNGLSIGIDDQTGSIVYLAYPATGVILDATPEVGGLLDLAYPTDSFPAMRLASGFSKARVVKGDGVVTIHWDQLGPSRSNLPLPRGGVQAEVAIKAAPDKRSVILTCWIKNASSLKVPQILFPDLRGLKPFDGIDRTQLRLARGVIQPFADPVKPLHSAPFYVDLGWKHYPVGGYYSLNALRWLDYGSLKGGLSIFQKKWGSDDRPDIRTHRSEANPMRLRLLWEHNATVKPGEKWESGEFWLTPHESGWAKGIETFRDYVRSVNPPRELPPHVRDGIGFQTIWMIQTAETDPAKAVFKYDDLPRIAEDAKKHGLNELVPWGAVTYSTLPIPIRQELGSRQDLIAGVKRAKAEGVNVAPFISVQIVRNRYTGRYKVKPGSDDWTYHYELIPNFRPYYTDFWNGAAIEASNPVWRQDVKTALTDWINHGVSSFCWDVFSTKSVEGRKPDLIPLIEEVRAVARAKDPESTFSGESVTRESLENDGQVLDYTWNWVDYVDAGPILNVLRTPRLNCNVEDSPLVVKKAFADDLFINAMPRQPDRPNGTKLISEVPALSESIKGVALLRKQFLPYFVSGTYLGDSFLHESSTGFIRGYQLGNDLLVIVLNDSNTPRQISLQSNLSQWLPSVNRLQIGVYDESGKLVESKEGEAGYWSDETRMLQPLEMALFVITSRK